MDWTAYFKHDAHTGALSWAERDRALFLTDGAWKSTNTQWAGKPVTSTDKDGYLVARIRGRHFYAHRIIWEMHNGPIPQGMQIDHKDGVKANNRIANLRLSTPQQNIWNKARHGGTTGVRKDKRTGKYEARIRTGGKEIRLGVFADPAEAARAYAEASLRVHGKFSPFAHA